MTGRGAASARAFSVEGPRGALLPPVTFEVPDRGVVLVEGPSGAGKSTLLSAMAGLPRGDVDVSGELLVLGREPGTSPYRPDEVAYVPQDPRDALLAADALGEATARLENTGVPEADGLPRARTALARLGLADLEERESATLSGGEARRVALAAALAARPRLVLLDEPFAGLDAAWRRRVVEDVAALAAEAAVVVAEHRLAPFEPLAVARVRLPARPSRRPVPVPLARPRPAARVEARGLTVAVAGRVLVRDASFDLGPGVTALVGASGAGKTETLRALAGLRDAEGDVRLAGFEPRRASRRDLAARVGYAPQHAADHFTEDTAHAEVAAIPRALRRPCDVEAVLAAFGLAGLDDRHPWSLSGGERERLALAAAVAHDPDVLLLDEPTTGLDADGRARLLAALRDGGRCVVLATHDEDLVEAADRVLVLDGGRLVEADPFRPLVEAPP